MRQTRGGGWSRRPAGAERSERRRPPRSCLAAPAPSPQSAPPPPVLPGSCGRCGRCTCEQERRRLGESGGRRRKARAAGGKAGGGKAGSPGSPDFAPCVPNEPARPPGRDVRRAGALMARWHQACGLCAPKIDALGRHGAVPRPSRSANSRCMMHARAPERLHVQCMCSACAPQLCQRRRRRRCACRGVVVAGAATMNSKVDGKREENRAGDMGCLRGVRRGTAEDRAGVQCNGR